MFNIVFSGGIDYIEQTFSPRIFSANQVRDCVDIQIEDDSTVESQETLSAILSTVQERVTVKPDRVDITIEDNDRKYSYKRLQA